MIKDIINKLVEEEDFSDVDFHGRKDLHSEAIRMLKDIYGWVAADLEVAYGQGPNKELSFKGAVNGVLDAVDSHLDQFDDDVADYWVSMGYGEPHVALVREALRGYFSDHRE